MRKGVLAAVAVSPHRPAHTRRWCWFGVVMEERPFQLLLVNGQLIIVNGSWARERPYLGVGVCEETAVLIENREWGDGRLWGDCVGNGRFVFIWNAFVD